EPQPLLGTFFFSALRVEDFLPYFFFLVQQYCLADPRTGEWHSVADTGAHLGPSQAGYFVDVENILVVSDRQVNGVLVCVQPTIQDGPSNKGDRVLLEGEKTVFDQGRTERIRIFPTLAQVSLGGQQLQQPMGRAPAHPRHLHDLLQIRGPFGDCGDHPQTSVERLGAWRCRALGVHGSQIRQRPCFGETTGTHPTQASLYLGWHSTNWDVGRLPVSKHMAVDHLVESTERNRWTPARRPNSWHWTGAPAAVAPTSCGGTGDSSSRGRTRPASCTSPKPPAGKGGHGRKPSIRH